MSTNTNLELSSFRAPVTALAASHGFLFAGEGPFLRIRSRLGTSPCAVHRIFHTQAIHGIAEHKLPHDELLLLIWGGSMISIHVAKVDDPEPRLLRLTNGKTLSSPDWILDLSVSSSFSDGTGIIQVAILTAHNGLLMLNVSLERKDLSSEPQEDHSSTPSFQISSAEAHEITSGSRCILYSAHVKWIAPSTILLASGTAFGEIIVWSADLQTPSNIRLALHYVFTGHEGSIFGVTISDRLAATESGSPTRLLSSCSDDRSIRIWDLSEYKQHIIANDPNGILDALRDRESGFGANVEAIHSVTSSPGSLAVVWGHLSRIWTTHFVQSRVPAIESMRLVSRGEDATCQLWCIDQQHTNSDFSYILRHLATSTLHSGKHIWSSFAFQDENDSCSTISGGADGAIYFDTFTTDSSKSGQITSSTDIIQCRPSQILREMQSHEIKERSLTSSLPEQQRTSISVAEPSFRTYSFAGPQALVVTATTGEISCSSLQTATPDSFSLRWTSVGKIDSLKGYAVSASVPAIGAVLFGTADGVVFYHYPCYSDRVFELTTVNGKVAAIFTQSLLGSNGFKRAAVILTVLGSQPSQYLTVAEHPVAGRMKVEFRATLNLDRSMVVTSFQHSTALQNDGIVFMGTRNGSVLVAEVSLHKPESPEITILSTVRHVHSEEAVTSMLFVAQDGRSASDGGSLITVGHDGFCSILSFDKGMKPLLTHRAALPFGPSIEGLYIDHQTNMPMVYGFHSKHFKVLDLLTEQEELSTECGGAHRQWAFQPADGTDSDEIGGTLVWTRASDFHLRRLHRSKHVSIQSGGHGREIKAISITRCPFSTVGHLIATGAEDTDIRIFTQTTSKLNTSFQAPRCLRTLRKHVTGIQDLMWLEFEDRVLLLSSGGCEEFFVWRIEQVPLLGLGVVCEAQLPILGGNKSDLRIMGFDTRRTSSVLATERHSIDIVMAFSNSTIRIYNYASERPNKFELLDSTTYLANCLTQSLYLCPYLFVTTSTNGHVAAWHSNMKSDVSDKNHRITLSHHQRIHQSTIKSIAHLPVPDTPDNTRTTLLLTAGDDNAVGLTLLQQSSNPNTIATPRPAYTLLIPNAHAAAVTACRLVCTPQADNTSNIMRCCALTVSNDQRFKTWDIAVDVNKISQGVECISVLLREDVPSMIADANCLDVIIDIKGRTSEGSAQEIRAFVCGVGMEEWVVRA